MCRDRGYYHFFLVIPLCDVEIGLETLLGMQRDATSASNNAGLATIYEGQKVLESLIAGRIMLPCGLVDCLTFLAGFAVTGMSLGMTYALLQRRSNGGGRRPGSEPVKAQIA